MVYDVGTRKLDHIPLLPSRRESHAVQEQCGIHSAKLNPSKTMLVTGAKNPCEIGIYRLPTMDPLCVGEVRIFFTFFGLVNQLYSIDSIAKFRYI